jgi:hypothetical protein
MRFGYVENTERPDDPHMRTTSLSVCKNEKLSTKVFANALEDNQPHQARVLPAARNPRMQAKPAAHWLEPTHKALI